MKPGCMTSNPKFPQILKILLKTILNFFAEIIDSVNDEHSGPCADYKPGEDDLQAFDFIGQFHLDLFESKYKGVSRIRGSNLIQTAYKLEKESDLILSTR